LVWVVVLLLQAPAALPALLEPTAGLLLLAMQPSAVVLQEAPNLLALLPQVLGVLPAAAAAAACHPRANTPVWACVCAAGQSDGFVTTCCGGEAKDRGCLELSKVARDRGVAVVVVLQWLRTRSAQEASQQVTVMAYSCFIDYCNVDTAIATC
jgi:hypothetical protein